MNADTIEYLSAITDVLRDVCGAIIDNMPPDAQTQIADAQVRLIEIDRALAFRHRQATGAL